MRFTYEVDKCVKEVAATEGTTSKTGNFYKQLVGNSEWFIGSSNCSRADTSLVPPFGRRLTTVSATARADVTGKTSA